uniref:EF-hand domain-containing protein n=1 Tax=Fibrocapsa japonica TaxID=94617 RepID=A0A7S2V0Q4_9STRA
MREAFQRFDLNHDDRIDRREQVLMYKTIQLEMEEELKNLTANGMYEEARSLESRLMNLRQEFEDLHHQDFSRQHDDQTRMLRSAKQKFRENLKATHQKEKRDVEIFCRDKEEEMAHLHKVQLAQLEMELASTPMPKIKFSRRLLELQNSERNLSRQKQYEEAKAVRRMIDHLQPREEEEFRKKFEQQLQRRRDLLDKKQEEERKRLAEKLSEVSHRNQLLANRVQDTHHRRLEHLTRDMNHAHAMERLKKPEMSVHPSALLQQRASHQDTAAALRGSHLLTKVMAQAAATSPDKARAGAGAGGAGSPSRMSTVSSAERLSTAPSQTDRVARKVMAKDLSKSDLGGTRSTRSPTPTLPQLPAHKTLQGVYVTGLCDLHSFSDDPPDGTIIMR